jgi:hypothetical protein
MVSVFVLVAVPCAVVTLICPLFAEVESVTTIFVGESTLNFIFVPSTMTAVAPFRFLPAIVTFATGFTFVGVKLEIAGDVTANAEPAATSAPAETAATADSLRVRV